MVPNKNDIYWYPGLRRLMPVPWKYNIPDFSFIDPARNAKRANERLAKQQIINNRTPSPKKKEAPKEQTQLF